MQLKSISNLTALTRQPRAVKLVPAYKPNIQRQGKVSDPFFLSAPKLYFIY
jgi:hypothetical protein